MRANNRPMNQPTISLVGRHSVDDRSIKKVIGRFPSVVGRGGMAYFSLEVGRLSVDSRPIVGRRSADAKPMTKTSKLSADENKIITD